MRYLPLKTAMAALCAGLAGTVMTAPSAEAGLLLTPQGLFLTEPESRNVIRDATGQARFGGPASGYRRFGREGYFPEPYDPALPRQGRSSYGGDGFSFEVPSQQEGARKLLDFSE
ncbi:MAG: hypothetical protein AAGI13_11720 [Pseudomonadota bacterium]